MSATALSMRSPPRRLRAADADGVGAPHYDLRNDPGTASAARSETADAAAEGGPRRSWPPHRTCPSRQEAVESDEK